MSKLRRKQTIVARAVIIRHGKILLTKVKQNNWYFLPGGHVESGEFVLQALNRELIEELGTGHAAAVFIGVHDNRYFDSRTGPNQELGLIFAVRLRRPPNDRESHLMTSWAPIAKLGSLNLKPHGLGQHIRKWIRTKRVFWMRQNRKNLWFADDPLRLT